MLQYHMIADGRVQGVGFRYFVQMEADRHKIAGWVKNRDDGRVEILAEGPEESLKQFAEAVRKGSHFSNVTNVTIEESHRLKGYRTFSISY
ncbi:acylphosphatase [Bacillus velezensis]